jgi:hypothetical protein
MNSTQNNNPNPLTSEEISKLHGEDLKKALANQLSGYKNEVSRIDSALKDICEDVEKMPEVDAQKAQKEDAVALAEIEKKLDDDLNNAVLDLATEDEILKDVDSGETEE